MVKNPASLDRYLTAAGELTEVPGRSAPALRPTGRAKSQGGRRRRDGGTVRRIAALIYANSA